MRSGISWRMPAAEGILSSVPSTLFRQVPGDREIPRSTHGLPIYARFFFTMIRKDCQTDDA